MSASPIKVAITGAAGQIGYAMLFRIASGEVFGPNQPVALSLLEIPAALPSLQGTLMELEDCAFPLLAEVHAYDDAEAAFAGANWVILVGGMPRKDGMSRADLIRANGPIFTTQGKALNAAAAADVRVLVVANPCNTNCLIAKSHAPTIPSDRWFAMTRLDQNRAIAQLARKAGVGVGQVKKVAVWGNHSDTQYPDYGHAVINGQPATSVITDHDWFLNDFVPTVAKRGGAVIKARGASSAASAANAALDTIKSCITPTPADDWFSAGVFSNGNPYGIPEGLIYSMPLTTADGRTWNIVPGLELDGEARRRIEVSAQELLSERDTVHDLLGPAI